MYFFRSRVMDWQNDILEKIKILFRGIGQVMFQNNAWSGVLMLVGIACDSLYMAGLALLGAVVSTSTARIVGYSRRIYETDCMVLMGLWSALPWVCL